MALAIEGKEVLKSGWKYVKVTQGPKRSNSQWPKLEKCEVMIVVGYKP